MCVCVCGGGGGRCVGVGRGFLQVDEMERLEQHPTAEIKGKKKRQSEWAELG